jgi:hypothetical protein
MAVLRDQGRVLPPASWLSSARSPGCDPADTAWWSAMTPMALQQVLTLVQL